MKAIAIDDFGSAPSLRDVPRPPPAEGAGAIGLAAPRAIDDLSKGTRGKLGITVPR
jgi:hypothetical protein